MDNLTHTLIGVTTTHCLPEKFRKPSTYWALVIGNNFPDSDFIYSKLPDISALDYLVHHRGYTHSFLLSPLCAVVTAFIASRISRTPFNRELFLFSWLGVLMHVSADALNNYGVHPFSPISNRWFYADTVFIIEPFLWMLLLPLAWAMAIRKSARALWLLGLAAGIALIGFVDLVHPWVKVATTIAGLASFVWHWKRRSPRMAATLALSVVVSFAIGSIVVKGRMREAILAQQVPANAIADIDASPLPGNPFRWISRARLDLGTTWETRQAKVVLSDGTLDWDYRTRMLNKDVLENLMQRSCELRRLMTFLRFPYVEPGPDGSWIAGDLRYDRPGTTRNFTEFAIKPASEPVTCPRLNEPWDFPSLRHQ